MATDFVTLVLILVLSSCMCKPCFKCGNSSEVVVKFLLVMLQLNARQLPLGAEDALGLPVIPKQCSFMY